MKATKRKHSPAFKAKIALAAIQEQETIAEISRRHKLNANLIYKWKREFLKNMARVFELEAPQSDHGAREAELLQKIGELTVERDFLSRGLGHFR